MAKHNSHRAPGPAVIIRHSTGLSRAVGGTLAMGTVLVGSALGAQAATAAPAPNAPASTAQSAAPQPAAPQATALRSGATLHWGSTGERVSALQSLLNAEGANLAVDGIFGPRTHEAVLDFQRSAGIKVDGRVGPETRGALNSGAGVSGGAGSTSAPVSSGTSTGQAIVDAARSQKGVSYSWGSSKPGVGFDCSGLVKYAYAQVGIDLPHGSSMQANGGRTISQSQAQPGDIVAWPGHVGIYAGNGKIIDASGSQYKVVERSIWGSPTFVTYR